MNRFLLISRFFRSWRIPALLLALTACGHGVSNLSSLGGPIAIPTSNPPSNPISNHAVHLSWTDPTSTPVAITSYNIYRGAQSGGPYTAIGSANDPTAQAYTDSTVVSGVTYYYVVTSYAASVDAESIDSNEIQVIIP